MSSGSVIGQTLDDKYKIINEIGKGGMGAVYLATHIGTERPVALKIIAPQYMQRLEFVERFKREARAAGRLRHPNVVNVTDFGFADTKSGNVAYLVMEYLDGCTLGEVLEEENRLPLMWSLDILDQVCSAVQEAHEQGIIHRDLKPDNIWLEPNQRGGYTVKVLDFGIAKLEDHAEDNCASSEIDISIAPNFSARATIADAPRSETVSENKNPTAVSEAATIAQFANSSEAGTLIQPGKEVDLESGTAILPVSHSGGSKNFGTKLQSAQIESNGTANTPSTNELTRVGAVLGTPLYMSPEQCRGERLTARSDIYSLGVIAYQMLSGKTPFSGDYQKVMEAHRELAPPPLDSKKIPKKVKEVVAYALSKNIEDRPPDAQSFAAELRAQSEGIGALYRRALSIYSEHLPKFLGLSILIYLPITAITIIQVSIGFLALTEQIGNVTKISLNIVIWIISTFLGVLCGYLVLGTSTWLVSQILAVPLRPLKVRPALHAAWRHRKTFAGTGMMTAILTVVGYVFCIAPGLIFSVVWALVAPVVMMENLRGFDALRRSYKLIKRSLRTTIAAVFIMFFVPLIFSFLIAYMAKATVKDFESDADKIAAARKIIEQRERRGATSPKVADDNDEEDKANEDKANENKDFNITINGKDVNFGERGGDAGNMGAQIRETVQEALTQILLLPFSILIGSFSSIIVALLYLKTRQVGGESMKDLLKQFEETDQPRTNWQKRVHERLEQSGRMTSKTS